jgi:cell division protein FtsW (lipid II flippase)
MPVTSPPAIAEPRVPTRRGAELVLLVFSIAIVFAAEAIVEATRDGTINSHLLIDSIVPLAAGVIAHLVIRRVAPYADPLLLPIVVLLNGLGLVMIHRLDLGLKQQSDDGTGPKFTGAAAPTQIVWTALGLLLFLVIIWFIRDHRVLARYANTLALAGMFFLVLPAVLQRGERRAHLDPGRGLLDPAGRIRQDPADDLRLGLSGEQA